MSKSQVTKGAKRLQEIMNTTNSKPVGSLEERVQYVIDKLKISIVKYNIDLLELFKKVLKIFN